MDDPNVTPQLPAPRTLADQIRDRVAAVIAASVAVATALKVWDHLGPNAAEIALAVENLLLMIAALVFSAVGSKRDAVVSSQQRAAVQGAFRRGLFQPIPPADGRDTLEDKAERDTNPTGLPGPLLALVVGLGLMASSGCQPGSSSAPGLGAVLSRVDVARVLECRKHVPDWRAVALCVGAEAATQGLQVAFDEASKAIDRIPNPNAGAEVEPEAEERYASELEESLERLGQEIAATHAAGGGTLDP